MSRSLRCFIVLLVSITLGACSYDTLYSNLDEQQANEMLALLLRADLDGRKVRIEKGWSLQVIQDDLPPAVEILKSHGYPRDDYQSLGDVFKKEGFVSSPLEERARLLYGLSQELSKTISEIDGVLVARVHLAIPEKDVLSDERTPSSASIFIKHRPESAVPDQLSAIKALVVNSVEGLPYDNVTVTLFEAELSITPTSYESIATTKTSSGFNWQFFHDKNIVIYLGLVSLFIPLLVWLRPGRRRYKSVAVNNQD